LTVLVFAPEPELLLAFLLLDPHAAIAIAATVTAAIDRVRFTAMRFMFPLARKSMPATYQYQRSPSQNSRAKCLQAATMRHRSLIPA